MKFMLKILDKVVYNLNYTRFRLFHTLYFNFRVLPLKHAIKLPIYLYGKVSFYFLESTVSLENCKITRGMIKIGMNKEYLGTSGGTSLFVLNKGGKVIFNGPCEISSNFLLRVGHNAELSFGKNIFFGSSVKIVCINNVSIGESTRIAFESQLIDSDFHYTYNLDNKIVKPREKPIIIGPFNWIGNRTTISKGTITGPFTIAASSSILNKDYTTIENDFPVIAGLPAKLVAKNIRRIYDLEIENRLSYFFANGGTEIPADWHDDVLDSFDKLSI